MPQELERNSDLTEITREKPAESNLAKAAENFYSSASEGLAAIITTLTRTKENLHPAHKEEDKKDPNEKESDAEILRLKKEIEELEKKLKELEDQENPNFNSKENLTQINDIQNNIFSLTQGRMKNFDDELRNAGRVSGEKGNETISCYSDEEMAEALDEMVYSHDKLGLRYEIKNEDDGSTTFTTFIPEEFHDRDLTELTPEELHEIHEYYEKEDERKRKEEEEKEKEEKEQKKAAKKEKAEERKKEREKENEGKEENEDNNREVEEAEEAESPSWASYVKDPNRQTSAPAAPIAGRNSSKRRKK